ncbi:rod shape-determining protein MreD [Bisgaardia hudsonensis]|uniref:Rod shape-determining protein MreD n=1 Tax=Bisgaardia hudsonensis TaxID=109472 RepID=A0A4R2N333_9PAST|nr:rod shape-determining protein MreD [Bisgaardia hudsonensis]QLB12686.1 rod shape-determining protein MreD [Bisgaardia hudsonensis]TCP14235.1 rod shape-determining protein MreD [Bisgaardia hudsonensis]
MKGHSLIQLFVVVSLFIITLVLEIAPWPISLHNFKPSWLILVLTYWVLAIPNRLSIGTGFILGILWDVTLGSVLGVHALVLSIFTYLIAKNHRILRNMSLWFQSLLMILFVFMLRFSIFMIDLFLNNAFFEWQIIWGAMISGLLWPWIFLLLRKIRRYLNLR